MDKDMFIAAHEELIGDYLETHPNATESEAYERTADLAYDRMTDRWADRIDDYRQRMKDGC